MLSRCQRLVGSVVVQNFVQKQCKTEIGSVRIQERDRQRGREREFISSTCALHVFQFLTKTKTRKGSLFMSNEGRRLMGIEFFSSFSVVIKIPS